MKCRNVQKKFSPYQDRELEPREQEQVTSHLLSCRACREQFVELERIWEALGELPEVQVDPFFYQRLTRRMDELPKHFLPVFEGFFQSLRVPVYALILFIGILVGTYLGNFLTRDGLFRTDQASSHPEEMTDLISLRVFDPLPPGTLGDGYVRMVSYTGKEPR